MSLVLTPPAQTVVPVAGGALVSRCTASTASAATTPSMRVEMGHTGREPPFFFLKPADAVVPVADGQTGADGLPDADRATCTTRSSWSWPSAAAGATSRRPTRRSTSGAMPSAWT